MKPTDFFKPSANTITNYGSSDAARRDDPKPSGRIYSLVRTDPNHAQAQEFALSGAPLLAHECELAAQPKPNRTRVTQPLRLRCGGQSELQHP
jgi:hypothetical protein